jgi:hypothetical protein
MVARMWKSGVRNPQFRDHTKRTVHEPFDCREEISAGKVLRLRDCTFPAR